MNEFKSTALRSLGYTGSIGDMFYQFMLSKNATNERDFWRSFVPSSNAPFNELKRQALASLGFTQGTLDEREYLYWRGAIRGPEQVTNGNFSDGSTGWILGTGWSVAGGKLVATAAEANTAASTVALTAGKTYDITVECSTLTEGGWKFLLEGGTNVFGDLTTAGTFRNTIVAPIGGNVYIWSNFTLTATFDNVSIREVIYP